MAKLAARVADQKKANDILLKNLRGLTIVTDYFLICSSESIRGVRALSDAITEGLEKEKVRVHHVEGYQEAQWILLDYGDLVVHVFLDELRRFYQLENLWGDAPEVDFALARSDISA